MIPTWMFIVLFIGTGFGFVTLDINLSIFILTTGVFIMLKDISDNTGDD